MNLIIKCASAHNKHIIYQGKYGICSYFNLIFWGKMKISDCNFDIYLIWDSSLKGKDLVINYSI